MADKAIKTKPVIGKKKLKADDRVDECIYTQGNNRFTVIVQRRINGRVYTKKTRNILGKQAARNKRNQYISDFQKRKDNLYKGGTSWPEIRKDYLEWLERKANAKTPKGHLPKTSTYDKAKSYLPTYTRFWDNLSIQDITVVHVEKLFERPEIQKLAPSTQKDILKYIRAIFKRNLESGRVPYNVARNALTPSFREVEKEVVWIRPDVMAKVFDYTHDDNMDPTSYWGSIFYCAYYLGARSGELYNLRWSDLEERKIKSKTTGEIEKHYFFRIHSSYNWKLKREGPTKSGHTRYVDATAIISYLNRLKVRSTEKEYVFPRNKEWEKGKAARALRQVLKEIKYVPKKKELVNDKGEKETVEIWPNFHSLRACFIMNLLLQPQGISLLTVQSIVGHSEYRTTKKYLAQLEPEEIHGTQELLKPYDKKKVG